MVAMNFCFRLEHTILHRLDARVKLAAIVIISLVCMHIGLGALAVTLLAAIWLLIRARCSPLKCLAGLKWYLVLLGVIIIVRALSAPEQLSTGIFDLQPSRQGLYSGVMIAGRLLVIALLGQLLTFTTRPSHLRSAVEWFLRPIPFVPHRQAATMIGLLVRFIPVILANSADLSDALRARAIDNRRNPLRRITFQSLPLLRRTFVTADRLASAMEARCYGASSRTITSLSTLTVRDWSVLAGLGCFCLLLLGIS